MNKILLKSIFKSNVPLVVCAVLCLIVSNFVILYEISFSYKVTAINYSTSYEVQVNKQYNDLENETQKLKKNYYISTYYFLDNGLVVSTSSVHLVEGRNPVKSGEILGNIIAGINIGQKIVYKENEYTVVGLTDMPFGDVIINPKLNNCDKYEIQTVVYDADIHISRDKIIKDLSKVYKIEQITAPAKIGFINALKTTPIIIMAIIMILLASLIYTFSIAFLLEKTEKTFLVYQFLGYSSDYIVTKFLMFVVLFISSLYVVCAGIFALIDNFVLLNSASTMPAITLQIGDYLLVFAVFLIVSIFMIAPIIKNLLKKSVGYKYV